MKKSLIAVALVATSFGAQAGWTLDEIPGPFGPSQGRYNDTPFATASNGVVMFFNAEGAQNNRNGENGHVSIGVKMIEPSQGQRAYASWAVLESECALPVRHVSTKMMMGPEEWLDVPRSEKSAVGLIVDAMCRKARKSAAGKPESPIPDATTPEERAQQQAEMKARADEEARQKAIRDEVGVQEAAAQRERVRIAQEYEAKRRAEREARQAQAQRDDNANVVSGVLQTGIHILLGH